jgi:outer membrane protein OmpA-like peptidoglycan-associated protein
MGGEAGAEQVLRQVSMVLSEYPKGSVVAIGFADSTGTDQDNLDLSRERGEAVKSFVLNGSDGTISSERMIAQGMGESNPVATNMSAAGRQMNRRVLITIIKALAE